MNPTNTPNQITAKMNKNAMLVIIVALVFVIVILLSLIGIYLLTGQKVTTGSKPTDITQVGTRRVNGPDANIRKQGDSYVVDAQMPIVIQTNEDGVNFKNNTDVTIGVFVPALQDYGSIKIPPGGTEGLPLKSLRRDSMVCVGNDKCNKFEFLGSIYPALFKGTIEIVAASTVTDTPTPTVTSAITETPTPTAPTTEITSILPSITLTAIPTNPVSNATIYPTRGADVSSQVNIYVKYVTGFGNARAINSPVKLVLKNTGETIAYGFTDNDGKSPAWYVAKDTQVIAYAYSPTDFTTVYCGNSVEFNTGSYGTTQNKDITLGAPDSSPCLTQ